MSLALPRRHLLHGPTFLLTASEVEVDSSARVHERFTPLSVLHGGQISSWLPHDEIPRCSRLIRGLLGVICVFERCQRVSQCRERERGEEPCTGCDTLNPKLPRASRPWGIHPLNPHLPSHPRNPTPQTPLPNPQPPTPETAPGAARWSHPPNTHLPSHSPNPKPQPHPPKLAWRAAIRRLSLVSSSLQECTRNTIPETRNRGQHAAGSVLRSNSKP